MSISVMSEVWKRSRASEGALLVLLSIADHAGEDGVAYPSVARLSERSRLSPRGVQYALEKLRSLGELEIDFNGGPRGVNLYKITLGGEATAPLKPVAGVKATAGGHEASFTTPTKLASPGTTKEPSIEPPLLNPPLATKPPKRDRARELFALWNSKSGCTPAKRFGAARRSAAMARLREEGDLQVWANAVERISRSPFCLGHNDREWVADIDWFLRPDTLTKIEEGKYDDRVEKSVREKPDYAAVRREYDRREAERLGTVPAGEKVPAD